MQLEIITPDKKVFSGEVSVVTLPGTDGSFQILKDHAPIVSTPELKIDTKPTGAAASA